MTAKEIVEELKPLGKVTYKKTLLNHGIQEPFFSGRAAALLGLIYKSHPAIIHHSAESAE